MRTGEKVIIGSMVVLGLVLMGQRAWQVANTEEKDPGIPYYSTASVELKNSAAKLMRDLNCRECHKLWALKDITQNVPAPALDGMGSMRDEAWLYEYFSAENPQEILPSRLKAHYRMPSYAHLAEDDRKLLAAYIATLKVEDWYLEETKKARYEKLTGKPYNSESEEVSK